MAARTDGRPRLRKIPGREMSLPKRWGYTGMNTSQTHTPRAGRREWMALAVIALPCLLYSMDLDVLYLALPLAERRR